MRRFPPNATYSKTRNTITANPPPMITARPAEVNDRPCAIIRTVEAMIHATSIAKTGIMCCEDIIGNRVSNAHQAPMVTTTMPVRRRRSGTGYPNIYSFVTSAGPMASGNSASGIPQIRQAITSACNTRLRSIMISPKLAIVPEITKRSVRYKPVSLACATAHGLGRISEGKHTPPFPFVRSGVDCGRAGIFREPGKAAMRLPGSVTSPAHGRSWVDS